MEKNLYIDASHPNEIRVVLKSDNRIEDYEYEGLKNSLIKKTGSTKIKWININVRKTGITFIFWACSDKLS